MNEWRGGGLLGSTSNNYLKRKKVFIQIFLKQQLRCVVSFLKCIFLFAKVEMKPKIVRSQSVQTDSPFSSLQLHTQNIPRTRETESEWKQLSCKHLGLTNDQVCTQCYRENRPVHLNKWFYSIKLNIVSNYPGFWKISPMINEFIQLIHVNRKSILMLAATSPKRSIFTIFNFYWLRKHPYKF